MFIRQVYIERRIKANVDEIIFDKSKRNLKKIYNRIHLKTLAKYANLDDVLFLAIGGYNRTFELLQAMGLKKDEIATFSNLNLTTNFLLETHGKKCLYIKKINYVTSMPRVAISVNRKMLDLNIADAFQESMMIYKTAGRKIRIKNQEIEWLKPSIVILDDQSLNLQYDNYRFQYQTELGFVQIRNRNADPYEIVKELKDVEEADKMMFALYQKKEVEEVELLNCLDRLREAEHFDIDNSRYIKPTIFKKVCGSQEISEGLKSIEELGIYQLSKNKKIGKANARWVVIPETAFDFKGYTFTDEEEIFEQSIKEEEEAELTFEQEQQKRLDKLLDTEIPLNVKVGFVGSAMANSKNETLKNFIDEVDNVEQEKIEGIKLLNDATTDAEYKHIKKYNLLYFLDGNYKNDERSDENYLGGKRLVSIDIDDGDYSQADLEEKLESHGLFGIIYRTAKYYFDESNRWRIIMLADEAMSKEDYKNTVSGIAEMLDLVIDNASKKISQLMGYPLSSKDISMIPGSTINVSQFKKEKISKNVVDYNFSKSKRSLKDFNHAQAKLLKDAIENGVAEGARNETYSQIYMYLNDTLCNPEMSNWHQEAMELMEITRQQALSDGLPESEVRSIYREK